MANIMIRCSDELKQIVDLAVVERSADEGKRVSAAVWMREALLEKAKREKKERGK